MKVIMLLSALITLASCDFYGLSHHKNTGTTVVRPTEDSITEPSQFQGTKVDSQTTLLVKDTFMANSINAQSQSDTLDGIVYNNDPQKLDDCDCGMPDNKNVKLSDILSCIWSSGKPYVFVIIKARQQSTGVLYTFNSTIEEYGTNFSLDNVYQLYDKMEQIIHKSYGADLEIVAKCCDAFSGYACASKRQHYYKNAIIINTSSFGMY